MERRLSRRPSLCANRGSKSAYNNRKTRQRGTCPQIAKIKSEILAIAIPNDPDHTLCLSLADTPTDTLDSLCTPTQTCVCVHVSERMDGCVRGNHGGGGGGAVRGKARAMTATLHTHTHTHTQSIT